MKKINTIMCMLLFFIFCSVQAQQGWDLQSENVAEIKADGNHYYALHRGFTPKKVVDGFLNSNTTKIVDTFDNSCIFQFVEVSTKETTDSIYKVYVLQNLQNKQYICTESTKYTASISKAFRFTARKAIEILQVDKSDWNVYSHAVLAPPCAGAQAAGTWVFCNPDRFQFLSFEQNRNPGFNTGYIECTNWFVYEVTPKELSPFQKFMATYEEHIVKNPLTPENYPVGTNPGCISQELYNKIAAVYKETGDATVHRDMSKEQCEHYTNMILNIVDEYHKGIIQVTEGKYYVIQNCIMGFTKDNGKPYCDGVTEFPTAWNVENAEYIWLADSTSAEGGIFYQNLMSERYLSKKAAMSNHPLAAYTTKSLHQGKFSWFDGTNYVTAKKTEPNKGFFNNGSPDFGEGQWKFIEVKKEIVDSMANSIAQHKMTKHLSSLVTRANNNINGLQYENSITFDGNYVPAAKGLVNKFELCNSTDTHEGSKEENAFDGNVNTFYHTCWNKNAPSDDWAWVQVDLGRDLKEIVLKMSKREPRSNVAPIKMAIFGPQNDDTSAHIWSEELYNDTVVWTYATQYPDTIADSTTYIKTIKFPRPVRHIRLTATMTPTNKIWGYGPTWAIGEMRFYDPAECIPNEKAKLIPAEVMKALKASIAKAQNEVDKNIATQETYDELEAALDSMWATYPNPGHLISEIQMTESVLAVAEEAESGMGYYRPGAKQALQTSIDALKAEIESKVLTLDDINRLQNSLETANQKFNSMLITPEPGIYRIVTASTDKTGAPDNQFGSYISATHADKNGDIYWKYKDDAYINNRWNTLWKVEKNAEGAFSFMNLANGLYIENPFENLDEESKKSINLSTHVHWGDTATYFNLLSSTAAGKFVISLDKKRYINAAVVGHMAIWSNRDETHSRYTFEAVNLQDMQYEFNVDCEENKIQILALPIDIDYVSTFNSAVYKILGIKDNSIILKLYTENDKIPAGTPFIAVTGKGEKFLTVEPTAQTGEEWLNCKYNRMPVELNGLVSAPQAFEIEPGYGIIFGENIIVSAGGEKIASASGFINKNVPTTTENGDLAIPLKGNIIGDSTGIEDLITIHNVANDVYTISGVKVRQNVKGAATTNGLPKGIYIVGGKKVIVK